MGGGSCGECEREGEEEEDSRGHGERVGRGCWCWECGGLGKMGRSGEDEELLRLSMSELELMPARQ